MAAPAATSPFSILTVTWSADRRHFGLLSDSLAHSSLADLPHDVIVQTEDLSLFETFRRASVVLHPTCEILPKAVEENRLLARHRQEKYGRRATRLLGSASRRIDWPDWPRYTGWHTQQICKLAYVAKSGLDRIVIMDSDLVVTDHARPEDFTSTEGIVCFSDWRESSTVTGRVKNWQTTAHQLLDRTMTEMRAFDCYFDTPFVMHAASVRRMLQWLEDRHSQPWWKVLLSLPPRRWSEFCVYKTFLRNLSDQAVDWRNTENIGYLFNAGEPELLGRKFLHMADVERRHYITIHSQSSGRRLWTTEPYEDIVRSYLLRTGE